MNTSLRLIDWLPRLADARILCVGDIMLDRYVYGAVDRVSPEAPIPVLRVQRESAALGGAGNVAHNLAMLGASVQLVAAIGADDAGSQLRSLLASIRAISADLAEDSSHPTTIKIRYIAGSQQLLRADQEAEGGLAEAVGTHVAAAARSAIQSGRANAVILSDYGKGVLTPPVIAAVIDAARAASIPVIVDPKGSDYGRYAQASVLTPNRRELAEATRLPVDDSDTVVAAARQLVEAVPVANVLATRGGEGMTLVGPGDGPVHLPALAREVFDVSGAGDTVVAVLAAGMGAGMAVADAAQLANVAAGIVVGKVGTAALRPEELADALAGGRGLGDKILDTAGLADRVAQWRARGLRIGFTNGCFDLVHPGHISLLEQASAACDRLVVALNSNASVRGLKGEGRPVQDEAARARVLASLAGVDAVTIFDAETPLALIESLRPDVLVKGADYTLDQVVGGDIVQSYGGQIVLADLVDGFSTTATVNRLARG